MSNYTKTTDFEAKDSLPTGDSGKIIRGAEFETEFDAIATAVATKADTAGPTFTGTLTFDTISDGTISIGAFVDEDDMSSNSAVLVPTQQSVKAYVDAQVTAQDLDFQGDSGGALSIDLDSETMTIAGGTGINTSGSGNTLTISVDSSISTLSGSDTLTNKNIDVDNNTVTNLEVSNFKATAVVIESEGIGSNDNDTTLPTSAAVKDYVDSQTTAQDLDFQADSGGALSIDLDSEAITFTGGTGIDTSGSDNAVTFAIDSTVATLTGTQTLTNKTLTAPVISGNLTTDGTIDGRDVATDGTKLDGIEASATADQTDAEIRAAVEAATDSNVFTDADHTKLDGIEASADVTDTTNVTAAGALMDSELTNLTAVKALNQGVATTDSPTFAGLTTTANVSFGDNDKAIFGAGNDLQIYHSGSHSVIEDSGTGNLFIKGTNLSLRDADGNDYITMVDGGSGGTVSLLHLGSTKLATTSTGIDVTGSVTADDMIISDANPTLALYETDTTNLNTRFDNGGGDLYIQTVHDDGTNAKTRILVDHSEGDISFYEDTGTTAKLFWDASAESLGIGQGVFSGTQALNLKGEGIAIKNDKSGNNNNWSLIRNTGTASTSNISFVTGAAEALVLAHDTNVGIGTDSPNSYSNLKTLTINGTNGSVVDFETNGTLSGEIFSESNSLKIDAVGSSGVLKLLTNSAERMRITSAGDVEVKGGNELRVYRTDNATYGSMEYLTGAGGLKFKDVNGDGITFAGPSSDYMRILTGGNVGIGTSSPTSVQGFAKVLKLEDSSNASIVVSGGLHEAEYAVSSSGGWFGTSTNIPQRFATNNTERMRIDSSGNVGIGATPDSGWGSVWKNLQVTNLSAHFASTSTNTFSGLTHGGYYDGTQWRYNATDVGATLIQSVGSASPSMQFYVANSGTADGVITWTEAMRIDSSGNLLVGTTTTNFNTAGTVLYGANGVQMVRSNATPLNLNRTTSDGAIQEFYKDGTAVGSIGVSGGNNLFISGQAANHAGLTFATQSVLPTTQGVLNNNTVDLGQNGNGFKDLYLSGGVYVGGTGSANHLDDYEEGTFTPTITSGTVTYTTQRGRYTKIGRVVHIHAFVQIASISGSSGTAIISGLPFTAKNDSNYSALASKTNGFNWGGSATMITFQVIPNTAVIGAVGSGNNIAFNDVNSSGLTANDWIACTGHYVTDS